MTSKTRRDPRESSICPFVEIVGVNYTKQYAVDENGVCWPVTNWYKRGVDLPKRRRSEADACVAGDKGFWWSINFTMFQRTVEQ